MTKDEELRCEEVLSTVFSGLHNCPKIAKTAYFWTVNACDGISTFDFDLLTKIVFAAHDQCVRADISQSGPRMIKIILHPRHSRVGRMSYRHPTIEQALKQWRETGHSSAVFNEEVL